MVGISAVMLVVFYRRYGIHKTRHAIGSCENTTSSTKPEVRNISQRRKKRTEPRPQSTCTKIGEVLPCGFRFLRADRETDRQTDRQSYSSQYLAPFPGQSNKVWLILTCEIHCLDQALNSRQYSVSLPFLVPY